MYVYTYIHMYKYANNSQIYISSPDLNLHIFLTLYLMFPLEYSTDTSNSAHTEYHFVGDFVSLYTYMYT